MNSTNGARTSNTERAPSPLHINSDDDSVSEIECKLCDKSFWDVRSYEQHLNSKKHHSRLTKRKVMVTNNKSENQMDSDEEDNLNSDYTELSCADCSLSFSGYKPYISHIRGSVHAKNLKKQKLKEEFKNSPEVHNSNSDDDELLPKPIARCSLCKKEFSGLQSYKQHLQSSIHKRKLQEQKLLESLKTEHSGMENEAEGEFFQKCDTCDKSFNGLQSYYAHMNSSIHQKALKRIEMENSIKGLCTKDSTNMKFICNECQKPFTDPFAFKSHLDNNSHKKYDMKKKILDVVNDHPDIAVGKTIQNASVSDDDDKDSYRIGDYLLLCKLCHMSFTGPESALAHVESKKHLKVKEDKANMKLLLEKQKAKKLKSNGNHKKESEKSTAEKTSLEDDMKKLNVAKNGTEELEDFELI